MIDTPAQPTAEEIAAARALVATADAALAADADKIKAARAAELAPLRDFAKDDAFQTILGGALVHQTAFSADPAIGPHLVAIIVGMKNLQAAIA